MDVRLVHNNAFSVLDWTVMHDGSSAWHNLFMSSQQRGEMY